jgi:hypothetical protein
MYVAAVAADVGMVAVPAKPQVRVEQALDYFPELRRGEEAPRTTMERGGISATRLLGVRRRHGRLVGDASGWWMRSQARDGLAFRHRSLATAGRREFDVYEVAHRKLARRPTLWRICYCY